MSFGEAFGNLIKKKRGVEGLTQQALAVAAFGDERYKTRISELENGKVSRPQSKTIDALVLALNITDGELTDLLNQESHLKYVDNLTDFFDASRTGKLHAEIAIRNDGTVLFLHDCPLKCRIKRLEFFVDESTLVWVTDLERRRHFGMALHSSVTKHLVNRDEVEFYLIRTSLEDAEKTGTYPLKIIS